MTKKEWGRSKQTDAYLKVRPELSYKDGILLPGHRFVIPSGLGKRTLDIAHEAHQGIVRLKQALRTKVWWPGIDAQAENLVRQCRSCQIEAPPPPRETITPTTMPMTPWHTVHVDLCGPLPSGETLLVLVDCATRWPEVEILKSTTTTSIISRLRRIFATHGLPRVIVSDNGPQFVSGEFRDYLRANDVEHRRITPYHPQANAAVERFNATVMTALRRAHHEGRNWRDALHTFLMTYRSTSHPATNASPSLLMFGREVRTKLPSASEPRSSEAFEKARQKYAAYKRQMTLRANRHARKSENDIRPGDAVIITRGRSNKLDTRYDPDPWKVISRKGTSVTIERNRKQTMRHLSQVKKWHQSQHETREHDDDTLYDDDTASDASAENPSPRDEPRRSTRQRREPQRLTYYRGGPAM